MEILRIDDAIIVLNKPAGLPVLPDGWDPDAPYLVRMLEQEYRNDSGSPDKSIWVVHRLDKSTSGVMVFARTAEAHRDLNRQFELHDVKKVYHAILQGLPEWGEKTAKYRLRANVGHKHRTAVNAREGKPAETAFRVLGRYPAHALVEAQPKTGRTHQVRAHAYALGYPLLGDVLYGAEPSEIIARPALHALTLTFRHPSTGQVETYSAPYPDDFQKALERLSA